MLNQRLMPDHTFNRQFWDKARSEAFRLPDAELKKHALVSIQSRHECRNCFCCACAAEYHERVKSGRWGNKNIKRS